MLMVCSRCLTNRPIQRPTKIGCIEFIIMCVSVILHVSVLAVWMHHKAHPAVQNLWSAPTGVRVGGGRRRGAVRGDGRMEVRQATGCQILTRQHSSRMCTAHFSNSVGLCRETLRTENSPGGQRIPPPPRFRTENHSGQRHTLKEHGTRQLDRKRHHRDPPPSL